VFGFVIGVIVKAVAPVFNKLCTEKAKSIATIITNDETTHAIIDYNYSDFVIVHKDEVGSVLMLESNMKNINIVISDVANRIQKSINDTKEEDVSISLGSFTGVSLFSGSGLKITIRISAVGNVKTDVKSVFTSAGINQTLHSLYLQIESEICILTPFNTINETIKNQLILAENIIVGEIPETYYDLNGMTSDDVMEVMQ
jgi:sporulation protein YunB